ncbi:MAG: hypothetical protein U1E51_14195 [Candidatus Binatia bacterium]|nr:hypothetical protein [Candidatus Binatia bacterium]
MALGDEVLGTVALGEINVSILPGGVAGGFVGHEVVINGVWGAKRGYFNPKLNEWWEAKDGPDGPIAGVTSWGLVPPPAYTTEVR